MNMQTIAEEALFARDKLGRAFERSMPQIAERLLFPFKADSDEARWIAAEAIRGGLAGSEVVIWTKEIWDLAITGSAAFQGTKTFAVTERAPQFWFFNRFAMFIDPRYKEATGLPESALCAAVLLCPMPKEKRLVWAYFIINPPDYIPHLHFSSFGVGEEIFGYASDLFACRAFMGLRLAAKEPVMLPRATRRRMQREQQPVPDIRVIQLREREHSGLHVGSREYHHRWIVKGHWRRLHELRKKDGAEVTFVHAYVKGPDSAPLLQPRESVYAVAR